MNTPEHILVVDDDPEIRALLTGYLDKHGFRAESAADGTEMFRMLEVGRYDLVVLDVMLPGDDGLTLCRRLRARSELPVIMLTALDDDTDRIIGLELGADDYVAKPFNPRELVARIRTVLRRARALPENIAKAEPEAMSRTIRFAGWTLDTVPRHLVAPDGVVVNLSGAEYRLLRVFLNYPNRVMSRDQLLDLTQGRAAEAFDRSIDVLVSRLRTRLRDNGREPQIIKTVRGDGYYLATDVERDAGADGAPDGARNGTPDAAPGTPPPSFPGPADA
ncbi:MAG: response regulator [Desulfovibrio sp.]|jgi:two-component system OmpR family response regulator|nr:response regulator [Desulfovibrio sp.]